MNNLPKALSEIDIHEIACLDMIREMWGAEDETDMREQLRNYIYGVRFDFHSGSPGYVGDVYILMGEALSGQPVMLIRDQNKQLIFFDDV